MFCGVISWTSLRYGLIRVGQRSLLLFLERNKKTVCLRSGPCIYRTILILLHANVYCGCILDKFMFQSQRSEVKVTFECMDHCRCEGTVSLAMLCFNFMFFKSMKKDLKHVKKFYRNQRLSKVDIILSRPSIDSHTAQRYDSIESRITAHRKLYHDIKFASSLLKTMYMRK